MTVANHYISFRKIPSSNVFYLKYRGGKASATGKVFREQILLPALREIEQRKLSDQIDYLVYSCDFPWQVKFATDFPGIHFPPQLSPTASLTGATYLFAFVKEKRREMFSPNSNFYCTPSSGSLTISRGFRSRYRWTLGGKRAGSAGLPYMLSAMLGVTYGRGNTTEEIKWYLKKSSEADETMPKGTVYFVKNNSPRSTPRHNLFPAAAREINVEGVRTQMLEGKGLAGKRDIIGMTTGAPQLGFQKSGCKLLPGAYCDNFTSAGGQFYKPKNPPGQTCISEFLRLGAAGANGTVVEPFAIQQKFPLPTIHAHYARGCSLAESFYQSVSGPYQQILVGDPLCSPWAKRPKVEVPGISPGKMLRGTVQVKPATESKEVAYFELFVDGVRRDRCKPGEEIALDTTTLLDGYHELRVVATDATPIETQGRWVCNTLIKNGRDAIELSSDAAGQAVRAEHVTIKVVSSLQSEITLVHNSRKLGSVQGGSGQVRIATSRLGFGPVAIYGESPGSPGVRSQPLLLELR